MTLRPLLLACCLTAAGLPAAQGQDRTPRRLNPDVHITQLVHRDWQVEDGLPQNSVYAVEQTRDGYLWLGTQEGLARFDGVRFTIFDKYRVDALPNHAISVLMEDSRGALWMGMETGGLARLEGGEFTVFTSADGLPDGGILALHEAPDRRIWIGTDGNGLAVFDGRTFETLTVDDGLAGAVVLSIQTDRDERLWVGTNSGLSRLEDGKIRNFSTADGLPGQEVRALHVSKAGALWIGTNGGLTRLRGERFQRFSAVDAQCGGTITDLLEDRASTIWIATRDQGVCRMTDGSVQPFRQRDGLSFNNVRVLFEDREGSLWIGTDGGGLNQIRGEKFIVFGMREGLSDDAVYSISEDRDGAVWIATSTGGLNRLKNGRVTHFGREEGLSSEIVLSVLEDRSGTLWAGTYDGGLCRRTDGRFTCMNTGDGLASNFVRTLYEDSRGALWIGTDAGIQRYTNGRFDLYTEEDGLPDASVISVLEDEGGDVWVGTGSGLARIREDHVVPDDEASEIDDAVLALHEDREGILWVGTFGGGLYRLANHDLTRYTTDDGLFDDTAIQILEDDLGNLWFASNKGIVRVPRGQFAAYDEQRIERLVPVVYNEEDGLRSREGNGGTQPAAWKDRDGRLWFSTMGGAAVIDPAAINRNLVPPPVVLEALYVNEKPVDIEPELTLEPGSKKFEFRYTGLSFAASEGVNFEYLLEGVDEEWVEAGSRREAYYTNLSPGAYTFKVRAANGDGAWSVRDAALSFYLEPRFYQTRWFYLLCIFGALSLSVGGYTLRTRSMKARQRALARLVETQTCELQNQKRELERLNHHLEQEVQLQLDVIMKERVRYERELIKSKEKAEESARLKASILANMSHEIRTPLAAILGYGQILSEEVQGEQQEFVYAITKNGNRLLETLDAILELSSLQNSDLQFSRDVVDLTAVAEHVVEVVGPTGEDKGLKVEFSAAGGPVKIRGDEEAVEGIIRKLLENAVKFTNEGTVSVEAGIYGEDAFVRVTDTGIGIGQDFMPYLYEAFKQESQGLARSYEGSGLGLAVVRHLVDAMNARIEVESTRAVGSTFTVFFPLSVGGRISSREAAVAT